MWNFPLFPDQASSMASRVDAVFLSLMVIGGGMAALVALVLVVFAVKYRAGSSADRTPRLVRSWKIEVVWITLPTLILLAIFIWAGGMYFAMMRPPADAMDFYVVGRQWMWKVQHPSGRREINTLHVPLGRAIKLTITSQDVVHSFFVPAFRMKMDAVPGRYTTAWFKATKVGRYHLFCAQYCGTDHAKMGGEVVVMPEAEYAAWVGPGSTHEAVPGTPGMTGEANAPLSVAGRGAFFQLGCNACHVPDSAVRAPRLDGLFGNQVALKNGQRVTADEQYIRESILEPNAKISAGYAEPSLMPTYKGQVSEDRMAELVEYIKSLRRDVAPSATTQTGEHP